MLLAPYFVIASGAKQSILSLRGEMDCFASLAMTVLLLPRDHFLDLAQLLLAEKHFLADKECRRAEGAALHGRLGVFDQFCLYVGILRTRQQLCPVEAGG